MNAEDQRISERVSSPGSPLQPTKEPCPLALDALIVALAVTLTLPSLDLAIAGPSLEAIAMVIGFYACLLFILGPIQVAKDFLIDATLPVGSFGPARPVRLMLAFGLVLVMVNAVAALLSPTSYPASLKWLILVGVLLVSRYNISCLLWEEPTACHPGNQEPWAGPEAWAITSGGGCYSEMRAATHLPGHTPAAGPLVPPTQSTPDDASSPGFFSSTSNTRSNPMSQTDILQRPAKEYKAGKTSMAIWAREEQLPDGTTVTRYSIRLQKSWRDKNGEWQESSINLFPDELASLRLVVDKTYEYVALSEREPNSAAA